RRGGSSSWSSSLPLRIDVDHLHRVRRDRLSARKSLDAGVDSTKIAVERGQVPCDQLRSPERGAPRRNTFWTVSGAKDFPWAKAPMPASTAAKKARRASSLRSM